MRGKCDNGSEKGTSFGTSGSMPKGSRQETARRLDEGHSPSLLKGSQTATSPA